jgi:hypothetical protein
VAVRGPHPTVPHSTSASALARALEPQGRAGHSKRSTYWGVASDGVGFGIVTTSIRHCLTKAQRTISETGTPSV